MTISKIKTTTPACTAEDVGDTYLSIKEINGHLFVVDQFGKVINGLRSCSAYSTIDDVTEITLTVVSMK